MSSAPAIALIIDDEVQIRRLLRVALESQHYSVFEGETGQSGLAEVVFRKPDVVILDLGLPDMDGTEVLRRLREWSQVPVVVLSVRDRPDDKISALDAGADDYVQKPFDTRELLARVRAVQRRVHSGGEEPCFQSGDLAVDFASRIVNVLGNAVKLTPIEYSLLKLLARHFGKVITRKQLLREVWGPQAGEQSQYLRVHLTHLRRKLADAGMKNPRITTESGIGYRLEEGTAQWAR